MFFYLKNAAMNYSPTVLTKMSFIEGSFSAKYISSPCFANSSASCELLVSLVFGLNVYKVVSQES